MVRRTIFPSPSTSLTMKSAYLIPIKSTRIERFGRNRRGGGETKGGEWGKGATSASRRRGSRGGRRRSRRCRRGTRLGFSPWLGFFPVGRERRRRRRRMVGRGRRRVLEEARRGVEGFGTGSPASHVRGRTCGIPESVKRLRIRHSLLRVQTEVGVDTYIGAVFSCLCVHVKSTADFS